VIDARDLSHEVAEPYLKPGITWPDMMATASGRVRGPQRERRRPPYETKAVFVPRVWPPDLRPRPSGTSGCGGRTEAPKKNASRDMAIHSAVHRNAAVLADSGAPTGGSAHQGLAAAFPE
jgi:hypothetical protein